MLWYISAFIAAFVKGLCGFANTLVFTSILGFSQNNVDISPVELVMHYPANLVMVWKMRARLNPRVYLPLICFVMLGSVPGAFLLKGVDTGALKIVFGVIVVFIGLEMLTREIIKLRGADKPAIRVAIGIVSGLMCGMFGIGALMAAYVSRVTESGDEFKANISMVFLVESTFRLALYIAIGVVTIQNIKSALLLMPAMLLGLLCGMKLSGRLDDKLIKKIVMVLLIISGIMLIVKNI